MYYYRALDRLSLEEYERVATSYRQYRKCVHCAMMFVEAENIGQMRCRLHPGVCRPDAYRAGDFYSCCGGTTTSVGCLAADHIGDELSETDEAARHKELFDMAFAVVPCGLFNYGLLPPSTATIFYDSRQQEQHSKRRKVSIATSFNRAMEEEFDLREVAHEVSESVKDSPILLRSQPSDGRKRRQCSRSEAITRLEAGWPSDFDNDNDDEAAAKKRLQAPDYTLPYVIVKRIY